MIEDAQNPHVSIPSDSRITPAKVGKTHSVQSSGFVDGGFTNLVCGFELEARRVVEEKYADEWNASGLLHRWRLQRKMDEEIAKLVEEKMPNVSSRALF
ncbi:MAG: hypothetical protein KDA51_07000 [Planctomycetales bacterium]|nr:hypothetical protein [Planctomycetales bacterium]MCA9181182.1 hypothetical protein [Planctomycetales bacterium]